MRTGPRAHVFGSCARVHAPIMLKIYMQSLNWVLSIFYFHKFCLRSLLLWAFWLVKKEEIKKEEDEGEINGNL